jgi:polyhydroxyalkanoate synthase
MYLLNARTLMQMADSVQGDEKTKARIRFAVQQWVDAPAPSNFLAFNPEALKKAVETKGESIATGMQHLLEDLQKGHVSQTDESAFEVGRNVATTAGDIVFENELFQLIEYKPLTAKVHERPMLFVPPCINKYYILDLQPENSVIRYTVEQGHRTFVVSWRNPDESMVDKTWDDYIEDGAIKAIRTVQAITGAKTINTLGFCVGGTILSTALAVLAARGEQPAHSVTLLTTLLDFESTGVLDIFVDEASVQLRDMTIGADAPGGPGLLKGKELATTFSFLRPNDLVWNYVVGNYLKGEAPPPFDLLYWNGDSHQPAGPDVLLVPAPHLPGERPEEAGQAHRLRREARPRQRSRRRSSSTARARTTSCRGRRPTRRPVSSRARSASCWAPRATSPASSTRPPRASAATGPTTSCRPRPRIGSPARPSVPAAGGPTGPTG